MKRREAIGNLILAAAAVSILPSCEYIEIKEYSKLNIDEKDWRLVSRLTDLILPKEESLEIETPESTTDFIFTNVNDCYTKEDILRFQNGLSRFHVYLSQKEEKKIKFDKLKIEEQNAALETLKAFAENEDVQYFYDTLYSLTNQHFTTSEYFMTNNLEYEFVPSRFLGCAAI